MGDDRRRRAEDRVAARVVAVVVRVDQVARRAGLGAGLLREVVERALDLLAEHGAAYDLNLRVFRQLQRTITGWPGGKPPQAKQSGDIDWPGDEIFPKRVLVFSPHPDDDVISMGGTLKIMGSLLWHSISGFQLTR